MTFARTKIEPPRLRAGQQIARPALAARLGEALRHQRVVLVCAAAGFGKTAALAQQVRQQPADHALAWVSLDEGDDLPRLLDCLVAALEPFDPPWRTAPEALVAAADDATRAPALAAELVNTLEACEAPHGVIVLDDLHRVSDPVALGFVDLLAQRLGSRWTLALATRHEPPLALPRLRAAGELAEFRAEDLRFSADETRELAQGGGLDAETADALYRRTQGWPAGLRLALNAQRGNGARPALIDRHVFDFLATEVIDQLTPELREFLLQCSLLDELDPARCAALTGNERAALLLDEVERLGLFASVVDGETGTLRLHDLFRETLQHRLARQAPAVLPALQRRAADSEPDPLRRIALLLRAQAPEEAASVLLAHGMRLLTEGATRGVQRLLDQFPPAFAARSPELLLMSAIACWPRWDFPAMAVTAQRAAAAFEARADDAGRQHAQAYHALALVAQGHLEAGAALLGPLRRAALDLDTRVVTLVASSWHAMESGSLHRVGPVLAQLADELERSDRIELWYQASPLPRFVGLPGTAGPLLRHAAGVQRLAGDRPTPLRGAAWVLEGWHSLWRGDLDEAAAWADRADADARWLGEPVNVRQMVLMLRATLDAVAGRTDAALQVLCRMAAPRPGVGDWPRWQLLFMTARAAAAGDDADALAELLGQLDALRIDAPARTRPKLALPGHLAWLQGRSDDAIAHWRNALAHEEQIDVYGQAAEVRLRLGAALLQAGQPEAAREALAPVPAATADGPGGVLFARGALRALTRPAALTELPPELQSRLRRWAAMVGVQAADHGDDHDHDHGDGDEPADAPGAARTPAGALPPAGLSERELEVLQRIAAGDSNKLIARALDLSPHTVKRHVANILGKLGCDSRGQAAAWLRRQH